ncbi:MAG: diguanylate cyclase, partial [Gammaproteobacteria bacterium]|nr:diguanylate cyclase [Gammaproteobacteria bacterium]NNL44795.1 diguanylate cyclase [Woeseiaceae bacterium]
LGGDEFVVMMAGQQAFSDRAIASMRTRAKDMKSNFSQHLGWSVGRVRFDPDRHNDIEDLLREADERMYADKTRRKKGSA